MILGRGSAESHSKRSAGVGVAIATDANTVRQILISGAIWQGQNIALYQLYALPRCVVPVRTQAVPIACGRAGRPEVTVNRAIWPMARLGDSCPAFGGDDDLGRAKPGMAAAGSVEPTRQRLSDAALHVVALA